MTGNAWLQLGVFLAVLALLVKPLGEFMARVYQGQHTWLTPLCGGLEHSCYLLSGIRRDRRTGDYPPMTWQQYACAVLAFNTLGLLAVYLLQRLQGLLPLNPAGLPGASAQLAFNTAVSFASNTNWQSYSGETTLSYLTQMLGLGVQNFLSAATGMAVMVAFIRGFTQHNAQELGNFWVDMTRSILYILLPLAAVLALLLVSQGVVQTFQAYRPASLLEPAADADGRPQTEQAVALGPAASQVAIKQLGTNGGGFFNANSAHPLENPTPLSNFLELLAILLVPAALCCTFGRLAGDPRQGWAVLAAMLALFLPFALLCTVQEQAGTPQLAAAGADTAAGPLQPGGNMEGKEARFGIVNSALWATATTAASNGSVNSMHDSYTPLGGLAPLLLMQFSEVVFGGVGSGLYGMLVYAIVAVFIAGLMVGRTPEYLGKKLEAYEMKMAALALLIPPLLCLTGTALAVSLDAGRAGIFNPGVHGFSEVLYNVSSAGNNNGSAFGGMSANTPFYSALLGVCMFASRYWLIIPVLALAGSLARKRRVPAGPGTLATHTPLFVGLLIGAVLLVGGLNFIPALALGPIVEHLQLHAPAAQQVKP